MTTTLDAIAFKSHTHPRHQFQNLYGLINSDLLYQSWGRMNKQSAPGVDGVTAVKFQQRLPHYIQTLAGRLRNKKYRAANVKRVLIPKANGKMRPLGLPTLEDKLVQQSVAMILESLWDPHFIQGSYGYRPNKSAHQAVHSLQMNLQFGSFGYIVEADIKEFFDNMDHKWLMEMLKDKVDDEALLNLINQWLKAKVVTPEGKKIKPTKGTPQGGVISPILANIYLHYALDIWFEKRVKPACHGRAMLIRYADDFVVAFQYKDEAEQFYQALPERLGKFGLELAADKTHIKRLSRFRPDPSTRFQFLGFEFYWGWDGKGEPHMKCRTATKKLKTTLQGYSQWIKLNRSRKLRESMPELRRKLVGFMNYFALPDNSRSVWKVYDSVVEWLYKWLNRRSQRVSYTWCGLKDMLKRYQIKPPNVRKRGIVVDWYF